MEKILIFLSLAILALPIIVEANAVPAFIYSEQMSRIGDQLSICYQVIDVSGNPIADTGLVLSVSGSHDIETTTDSDGIMISSITIPVQKIINVKIAKVFGNYTHDSDYDTKITVLDSGIKSEPKTTQITLAAKPSIKNTCVDQSKTNWEIWDQDDKTTTYYDLNTWTTVKTDKTGVIEITQAGKKVNAKMSLGTWQKDIDSVLIKNRFAPTTNPSTIQKVSVSDALKKSIQTKPIVKKDTKIETKKELAKKAVAIKAKQIKIKRGQTIIEKITGNIPMELYQKGQTADVSILKPDGTTEMQQIAVSSKGKFEHPFSITDKTKPGKYEITISYSGKEVKKAAYEIKS